MILFLEKNKGLYEHAIILSASLLLIFIDRDPNKSFSKTHVKVGMQVGKQLHFYPFIQGECPSRSSLAVVLFKQTQLLVSEP